MARKVFSNSLHDLHHSYEDNRNLYLSEYNFAFIKIPKVASTSLKVAFENFSSKNSGIPTRLLDNYKELFTAAFVRNPWDRLLSCYLQKNQKNKLSFFERNNIPIDATFEKFVNLICKIPEHQADRHFRSQWTFLFNNIGEPLVDYLGYFENLDADFRSLCNKINLPEVHLPHENKTTHMRSKEFYTKELAEMVEDRYKLDIKLLGYTFHQKESNRTDQNQLPVLLVADQNKIVKYKNEKILWALNNIHQNYRWENKKPLWGLKKRKKYRRQGLPYQYEENRNIYLPTYKILLYKIPKVASSTLWMIASKLLNLEGVTVREVNLPFISSRILNNYSDVRKVGFIRNPWDRLLSCYIEKKNSTYTHFFDKNNMSADISFEDFVKHICKTPEHLSDRHFRSQWTYLFDHKAICIVDFLGRFEFLKRDYEAMCRTYNLPIEKLDHYNKTSHDSYVEYYTKELIELVEKRYQLDIELLEYSFGVPVKESEIDIKNKPLSDLVLNTMLVYKAQKLLYVLNEIHSKYSYEFENTLKAKFSRLLKRLIY